MARLFGLLVVCLSLKLSHFQNCELRFLAEPVQFADSPLKCGTIIGETVVMMCEIEQMDTMQYQIGWHFSKSETGAGKSTGNTKLGNYVAGHKIVHMTGNQAVISILIIEPFEANLHGGFYWCEMFNLTFPTSGVINPSQIVGITAPFSSNQLECGRFDFNMFGTTARCALGPVGNIDIVVGVEFTNITTNSPSTTPTSSTQRGGADVKTSPENVVRTAITWFSVGAVTLILIMVAIILCSVAIAKY